MAAVALLAARLCVDFAAANFDLGVGGRSGDALLEFVNSVSQVCRTLKVQVSGGFEHLKLEACNQFGDCDCRLAGGHCVAGTLASLQLVSEASTDFFANGLRGDVVGFVVSFLLCAAAFGFVDCALHRRCHFVGIHDDGAGDIARCAPHELNEAGGASQEAFFVGVEDCDERNLRKIKAFSQEVHAYEHIEVAQPQINKNLDALERFDVAVQIAHFEALLAEICGKVFAKTLGEWAA